jgi:hypothetical protein
LQAAETSTPAGKDAGKSEQTMREIKVALDAAFAAYDEALA